MGKPNFIDKFMKIGGAFIVHGWCERYQPGDQLVITSDGQDLQTVTRAIHRPDLPSYFDAASSFWGFRAYGIDDGVKSLPATGIGIRFANGERIASLATACVPLDDHAAHRVWANFIAEVNENGGRLLEIGSRARSGSTIREQLNNNVEYIGVDIAEGPNVDIVGDAHYLSKHVEKPVDFVCSISTFEHFLMPWKVAIEINKILLPGGKVFSHSHQTWPDHDVPFVFSGFLIRPGAAFLMLIPGFKSER
ncbi:methyltransferase domain-containing protein [Sphingobium yanoikuyae]|uniref:methyltransferase domain-containing protein n=1 Tax=Sphingobium yanoikuyae TaxID=13690 RepID=UPI00241F58C5|nr:methyltransferase domain-containing protein [Sphingobium yanoikuyae]